MEVPLSPRLRFRPMKADDLGLMHSLLGDPAVMVHYERPKTLDESRRWISWNENNYQRDGFGLWIIETPDGDFVGDCGLTWQPVDGESLELGYHVVPRHQGKGLATEGAVAAKNFAAQRGIEFVIAIIAPSNAPSARVATKAGLRLWRTAEVYGRNQQIYRTDLQAPT